MLQAVESLIERKADLPTEAVEPGCEAATEAVERLPQYEMGLWTQEIEAFSDCEAVLWTKALTQGATAFGLEDLLTAAHAMLHGLTELLAPAHGPERLAGQVAVPMTAKTHDTKTACLLYTSPSPRD